VRAFGRAVDNPSDPTPLPLEYAPPAAPSRWRRWAVAGIVVAVIVVFATITLIRALLARRAMQAALSQMAAARANASASIEVAADNRCQRNLQTLYLLLLMYSKEHGRFPDSLNALLQTSNTVISESDLACPVAQAIPSQDATTKPARNSAYIYCGSGLTGDLSPDFIMVYEPAANHGWRGVRFLYADGGINSLNPAKAERVIAEIESGHNPPRAEMVK
jgi:hypothetical protein